MAEEKVVRCDQCKVVVKGDNSDSWAGLLPMPSEPLTKEQLARGMKRDKYSITEVDICFPCKEKLGDWLASVRK